MAILHTYCCPKCGYEVRSNPKGYDSLMSGLFFYFKCEDCKNIVTIHKSKMAGYMLTCPKCEGREGLSSWNPIDCSCPKCGEKMENTGNTILAD